MENNFHFPQFTLMGTFHPEEPGLLLDGIQAATYDEDVFNIGGPTMDAEAFVETYAYSIGTVEKILLEEGMNKRDVPSSAIKICQLQREVLLRLHTMIAIEYSHDSTRTQAKPAPRKKKKKADKGAMVAGSDALTPNVKDNGMPRVSESETVVFEKVREVLVEALGVDNDEVISEARLATDLGAESIDYLDLFYRLGKKFNLRMSTGSLFPDGLIEMSILSQALRGFVDPDQDLSVEEARTAMKRQYPHFNWDEAGKDPELPFVDQLFTVESIVRYLKGPKVVEER